MTPYELRFKIFQQAIDLANDEYQSQYATAAMWNDYSAGNTVKIDYPEFPTFEYIRELAEKINTFVSKN
jgi:hypothetical protein